MILFLILTRKCKFSQLAKWGEYNENTYHNWFKQDLDLVSFCLAWYHKSEATALTHGGRVVF